MIIFHPNKTTVHLFWGIISVSSYRRPSFSRLADWHVSFLWAQRAEVTPRSKLTSQQTYAPIHQVNSCGREVVHHTMGFTLSTISSEPLEALWVVGAVLRWGWGVLVQRKQVATDTVGGPVDVRVSKVDFFLSQRTSCALWWATALLGFMENDCRCYFAKAGYEMSVCLFGEWAQGHAVQRRGRRGLGTAL